MNSVQPVGVDGVNYTVTGDGPHTVVLLHGFSDNLSTWHRITPRLAVEHRVIAIDLPGFGNSSRPWTRPLLPGYVDVVETVLAAEGVEGPVSLVGNSMGAVVSALFARRHPHRVRRVALIDMPGLRGVPRVWKVAMSRPSEFATRTLFRAVPARVTQQGLGWFYTRIAAARPRDLDPFSRSGFCTPYGVRNSIPALLPIGRTLLAELPGAQLRAFVDSGAVPVLLVVGARDLLTPPRVLRRIGRPGGAVVLPGCGHCPQIDQPAALLGELAPFLAVPDEEPAIAV